MESKTVFDWLRTRIAHAGYASVMQYDWNREVSPANSARIVCIGVQTYRLAQRAASQLVAVNPTRGFSVSSGLTGATG
ncbi:MAG: hypothetical protein ACRETQ_06885 [Gammaproteobacteria bacterium]